MYSLFILSPYFPAESIITLRSPLLTRIWYVYLSITSRFKVHTYLFDGVNLMSHLFFFEIYIYRWHINNINSTRNFLMFSMAQSSRLMLVSLLISTVSGVHLVWTYSDSTKLIYTWHSNDMTVNRVEITAKITATRANDFSARYLYFPSMYAVKVTSDSLWRTMPVWQRGSDRYGRTDLHDPHRERYTALSVAPRAYKRFH